MLIIRNNVPPALTINNDSLPDLRFSLSVDEMRVMIIACTKHDPKNHKPILFTVKEWNEMFDSRFRNGRSKATRAAESLLTSTVGHMDKEPEAWVTNVSIDRSTASNILITITMGEIALKVMDALKPILIGRTLENVCKLNNLVTVRLYIWLKIAIRHFRGRNGEVVLSLNLDWLRAQFRFEDKHKEWTNLKLIVLQNPSYRINTETDLHVEYSMGKNKRTVNEIKFKVINQPIINSAVE